MSELSWYMHRLRRMPAIELPYRFRQLAKMKLDKYYVRASEPNCWGYSHNIQAIDLSDVEGVFPDLRTRVVRSAEDIRKHRFHVFGTEKDLGSPINWHLDPKTGRQWPLVFWGDIDYRDGRTIGGIKFAWELNRLQHLPFLAMAFQMTQDRRYREGLFEQLQSWVDGNPYPKGINWISGIEIGIRIVNLTYSLKLLGDESLSGGQQDVLVEFMSLSGRHLYQYHSKYSSCANHAVAEALGMFAVGLCFPDIAGAAKWKKLGKRVLEREVTRQIHRDGSSFEHSISYLQFVSETFLVYLLLGREYGEPCGEHVSDRLKASLQFLSSVVDMNGNTPHIGDGDDGCLLKLDTSSRGNLISLLNIGAVLFEEPKWIVESADYDLLTFCLLGGDSRAKWERLKKRGHGRPSAVQCFSDAGLVTIRDKSGILFVGNGGRLGLKPLGGHGHADCLSFWLSVKGQPIVVDPGTYLYHSGGKWRSYFRSTAAHTTLTVDGQDQAPMLSDFMFGKFYRTQWVLLEDSDDCVVWSAEHDGYKRLEDPVIHKRTITYVRNAAVFIIEDQLSCKGRHSIESLMHLHPDCLLSVSEHSVIIRRAQVGVTLDIDRKWASFQIISGQEDPPLGWYSPRFNDIQRTPTLVCRKDINGSARFKSIIRVSI